MRDTQQVGGDHGKAPEQKSNEQKPVTGHGLSSPCCTLDIKGLPDGDPSPLASWCNV